MYLFYSSTPIFARDGLLPCPTHLEHGAIHSDSHVEKLWSFYSIPIKLDDRWIWGWCDNPEYTVQAWRNFCGSKEGHDISLVATELASNADDLKKLLLSHDIPLHNRRPITADAIEVSQLGKPEAYIILKGEIGIPKITVRLSMELFDKDANVELYQYIYMSTLPTMGMQLYLDAPPDGCYMITAIAWDVSADVCYVEVAPVARGPWPGATGYHAQGWLLSHRLPPS